MDGPSPNISRFKPFKLSSSLMSCQHFLDALIMAQRLNNNQYWGLPRKNYTLNRCFAWSLGEDDLLGIFDKGALLRRNDKQAGSRHCQIHLSFLFFSTFLPKHMVWAHLCRVTWFCVSIRWGLLLMKGIMRSHLCT